MSSPTRLARRSNAQPGTVRWLCLILSVALLAAGCGGGTSASANNAATNNPAPNNPAPSCFRHLARFGRNCLWNDYRHDPCIGKYCPSAVLRGWRQRRACGNHCAVQLFAEHGNSFERQPLADCRGQHYGRADGHQCGPRPQRQQCSKSAAAAATAAATAATTAATAATATPTATTAAPCHPGRNPALH